VLAQRVALLEERQRQHEAPPVPARTYRPAEREAVGRGPRP